MKLFYVKYESPIKSGKETHDSGAFIGDSIENVIEIIQKETKGASFEIYAEHELSKDWK